MSSKPTPTKIGQYFNAVYPSYAMLAGLQLGVFTVIGNDSVSVEVIAERMQVAVPRLQILLYALVASELLICENDLFENTLETSTYLIEGKPSYLGAAHHIVSQIWDTLSTTAETIRTDTPQSRIDYHEEPDERQWASIKGLSALAKTAGFDLMRIYDLSHYKHIADVGGGSGGMAMALTSQNPSIQVTIIDLPTTLTLTESLLADVESQDRIHLLPMNVVANPIIGNYDAVVMRALLQVLKRDEIESVLQHTFDAISPGGYLYIMGRIIHDTRSTPRINALFNLVFINTFDEGQAYTESEYRSWLEDAGFVDFEIEFRPPNGASVIIRARKP